jgi:hypothetical protein
MGRPEDAADDRAQNPADGRDRDATSGRVEGGATPTAAEEATVGMGLSSEHDEDQVQEVDSREQD